jgi:hypothetical protein
MTKTTAQIDEALMAFGVATTQTEVDPDRRWEAIKFVSEFLGSLRIASLAAQAEAPGGQPQTSKEPIAWMWRDYTGYRQIGWKYPGAMAEDATPLYADTRPDREGK